MIEVKKDEDIKHYIKDYWTKRSESFSTLREKELHSNKMLLWRKELNQHIPNDKKLKILDVGCGSGFFSILLAKEGHNVTGIDITEGMCKKASLLAKKENVDINFHVMDAEKLEFEDESFDIVVSRNLTWNLPKPQNAKASFCPTMKIDKQTYDAITAHIKINKKDFENQCIELLKKMNFDNPQRILNSYPFELSGGMNQRLAIMIAMLLKPKILLADEPTASIDNLSKSIILEQLKILNTTERTAMIIVSHDIKAIVMLAKFIIVMKDGRIIETGEKKNILQNPKHDYTRIIIKSCESLWGKEIWKLY